MTPAVQERTSRPPRIGWTTCLLAAALVSLPAASRAAEDPAFPTATGRWEVAAEPVYVDPDDDWAKDPSVIEVDGTFYMYYTSANPWQGDGAGGKGEPRIDFATSPDGLHWTYQGVAIPKGEPGAWDEERPQAPAKPILKDGTWYLYYAGKNPRRGVEIGYATSTDLRRWTKHPGNPLLAKGKCNDPFIFLEDGTYHLFYTSGGDTILSVTSTDLVTWSAEPRRTGAVGEGSVLVKDGPIYTLFGCIGFSGHGEFYKAYTTDDLGRPFSDRGRIAIDNPDFASGTISHGDIIRRGDDYWFYLQGTRDGGRRFRIALAKRPVPAAAAPTDR